MTSPAECNITQVAGDTEIIGFCLQQGKTGVPIDLSGYSDFQLLIGIAVPGGTYTHSATLTGTITGEPTNGRIGFAQPSELAVGKYRMMLKATSPQGRTGTYMSGQLSIIASIPAA